MSDPEEKGVHPELSETKSTHNDSTTPSERDSSAPHTCPVPKIDLSRSVRSTQLRRSMESRLPVEDMIQRGLLKPGVSTTLSNRLQTLERKMKEDSVNHSLQRRPLMSDLVQRGIQSNPQLTSSLRAKAGDLEMKMKRKMMEKRLFQRPTPRELQQNHPGVYNSLSEEAKQAESSFEGDTILRVFVSFLEATAEQLLRSEKIDGQEYNALFHLINEEGATRDRLVAAVRQFNVTRDVDAYETIILETLDRKSVV